MKLMDRPLYTNKLMNNIRNNQIKLLMGVRRSGKTSILSIFQNKLINSGVDPSNIIYIDFESGDYTFITESVSLYEFLTSRISQTNLTYLILDEVQRIKDWQKVITALKMDFNVDIYISLSRANNISELGKNVTKIEILPLSLKEYMQFRDIPVEENSDNRAAFDEYLNTAMPIQDRALLSDIFYSIIAQDVLIFNKINDNSMMMLLIKILMSEMGKIHSYNSLCKLLSEVVDKAPAVRTVESYIKMLLESHLFYCVPVFDFRDNHNLSRYAKYYPIDIGFYKLIMGEQSIDNINILECIIYFELLRSGAKVSTCKIGQKKVAFLIESDDNKLYIHVTDSIINDIKFKAIMAPLRAIKNHYSKWVLTMDKSYMNSPDGIKIGNITEFLMDDGFNS